MTKSALIRPATAKFSTQLLKWIGNKQRQAHLICDALPNLDPGSRYIEPFLGSGAVLATLQPTSAIASDAFGPLIDIWKALQSHPEDLCDWYEQRWQRSTRSDNRVKVYEEIKASFNRNPNPADLLFLSRACYGGVIRFRKSDGHMSTPCGSHEPISPNSFKKRVSIWRERTSGANFIHADFRETLAMAEKGDVVYCDPPYVDSQKILYGAQSFSLSELFIAIAEAKERGARIALSIDGRKRSGSHTVELTIPDGLFEYETFLTVGRSMLRRFQLEGQSLEGEVVSDRLLLTYQPDSDVA